ncbi:MAG: glycosyltransferase [Arenicella sp.]
MAKVDLHLHSKYSDYPSTWLHKLYDSPESFTETDTIYQQAKARGMDFVTITDHDDIRGSLELVNNHPNDCFISCEVTAYFPEDNCKVHILVYDIDSQHYDHLMRLRRDLYHLRDYIKQQDLAYSVAHATYDQDDKLTFEHIEKLVLLFDIFEIRNGASSQQSNTLLATYLRSLTPEAIEKLQTRHALQTISNTPWIKGFTGGSDDHCGLMIGTTYTQTIARNKGEFIHQLRQKNTSTAGEYGSFQIYTLGIFKHLHDYQTHRNIDYPRSKGYLAFEQLFTGYRGNWLDRLKKSRSLKYLKRKNSSTHKALFNLLKDIDVTRNLDIAEKNALLFEHATELHNSLCKSVIKAFTKNLPAGDFFKLFTNLSQVFPMLALGIPFVGSLRHQVLKHSLKQELLKNSSTSEANDLFGKKALWFTDTIDDLNGVSVSLRQIATTSNQLGYQVKLVTSVKPKRLKQPLPENTINCKPIAEYTIPSYDDLTLNFPSILGLLDRIVQEHPDEILISTPGPVGCMAILCGKLLDIPVKGIYHTDFAQQTEHIFGDHSMAAMIDVAVNSFYRQMDSVYVPSKSYIEHLKQRRFPAEHLAIFPRGIDTQMHCPLSQSEQLLEFSQLEQLKGDFTMIFAGRVSADKNIALVCDIFDALYQKDLKLNLIIAGDGPDLTSIQNRYANNRNVLITGRVAADRLGALYSFADLLVFPSRTDTFGMVVLEGQACGLPALVSNSGGPQEIIIPEETGKVINTDEVSHWVTAIEFYWQFKKSSPKCYANLRQQAIKHVQSHYSWENVLHQLFGDEFKINSTQTPAETEPLLNLEAIA